MNTDTTTDTPQLKGLSSDFINELLNKHGGKNQYGPYIVKFDQSDEAGIEPADLWPTQFASKEPNTLYQGFNNAVKRAKLDDTILVKKVGDHVFLIHKERYKLLTQNGNGNGPHTDTDE